MTTANGLVDATEAAILNCYVGGTSITAPAACYLGIFSTAADGAGAGGVELAGNGYARKSCRAFFATPATAGTISNDGAFQTATASGAWLAGVQIGLFAASSGGVPFAVGPAVLPILANGNYHNFPVASITATLTRAA